MQTERYKYPDIEERTEVVDNPFGLFNIELTNKCPMRCVMCPRTNNMTREQGFMSFDLFKKIIDELVAVNSDYLGIHPIWLHHFGESLLHKEFGKCIRYSVGKNVYTGLSINPVMLRDDIARELIDSELNMLYISLDGHDDDSFHKIRGMKNVYQRSHDNLVRFLDLKVKQNSRVKIILSMIDFSINEESVEQTRKYWKNQKGVDDFLLKTFSTWDGNAQDVNSLVGKIRGKDGVEQEKMVTCNFPWERMTVTWNGDVVPCCYDYNNKLVLGNIKEQTLSEIWNGDCMRGLRREFMSNRVTNALCRNCDKLRLPADLRWRW